MTKIDHSKLSRTDAKAPTSSQVMSGTVAKPSRFADGLTATIFPTKSMRIPSATIWLAIGLENPDREFLEP
uniref:Uncharacterized protein n=1 Tax=Romanomermis culicivorax TaxID=13658 RepID=A0A915HKU2_ROMCU